MRNTIENLIVLSAALLIAAACSSSGDDTGADAGGQDGGMDGGADADADTDADTDSDADTDADADTDSDSDSDMDAGADASEDAGPKFGDPYCNDPKPGFNEDEPGFHMFLDVAVTTVMGMQLGVLAAGFEPTAREDFCNDPSIIAIGLDECTADMPLPAAPQCDGPEDCAPEQSCEQETDQDGQPIPGAWRCVTPRSLLDVGPFTITGFANGPMTLAANPAQNNGYLAPTADGTIPIDWFAWDTDYTFAGDGDPDAGIEPFSGSFHMAGNLALTKPAPQANGIVTVVQGEALDLEWTGGDPDGEIIIVLTGGRLFGAGDTAYCRVKDDGSFTVPASVMQQVKLNASLMLNALEIRRVMVGDVEGEGFTYGEITAIQSAVFFVQKKKPPTPDAGT